MSLQMDPYQARAVNSTASDILVSASAGAGKTRVLVERMIKRITVDHISIENIVAVTFTKAAAAEMKARVALRLNQLRKEENNDSWLAQQAALLDQAEITTIDSLCLTIIQKYYTVIGLDPALPNTVLSGAEENRYKAEAFDAAFETLYNKDPETSVHVLKTLSARPEDTDTLKNTVLSLTVLALRQPDPLAWIDQAKAFLCKGMTFHTLPAEIRHYFFLYYKNALEVLTAELERMRLLAMCSEKLFDKTAVFASQAALLAPSFEAIEKEDYDYFVTCFLDFALTQKTPPGDAEKDKEYKNLRTAYDTGIKKILSGLYPREILLCDFDSILDSLYYLYDLSRLTVQNYQNIKKTNACMDFADMTHFARSILLANDGAVAKLYQSRFKEVMVDEFQDTASLQDEILTLLAKGGTLFRVGDVKQSIYRFRGAEPSLMRNVMQDSSTENITLKYNYRSKENIVAFSNLLFSKIMNAKELQDSYTENDMVSIGSPRQKETASNPVQMILVQDEARNAKDAKATWIANEILTLHNTGQPFHNFAVLVRSHADKAPLKQAFDALHLPYDIDLEEGFYNSDLCLWIKALLGIILNPKDEISLLACITGNLFETDDDTLARYKMQYGSIREALETEQPEILQTLQALKEAGENEGILKFLDVLSMTNDFYTSLSEQDKANFDSLYERAILLCKKGNGTLWDLKKEMDSGSDEKSSAAAYLGNEEDVITVTTIHQSKGLQYPTVFLLSSGSNSYQEKKNMVTMDPTLYAGMKYCNPETRIERPSILSLAIEAKDSQEDIEEYNRLLYVALTRAEEHMYIVDIAKNALPYSDTFKIGDLLARKGITGIVTRALTESDGFIVREVYNQELKPYDGNPLDSALPPLTFDETIPSLSPLITPSAHTTAFLPDLDFTGKKGSTYGTNMHEILAKLPIKEITKEDLKPYSLSANAINAILGFTDSSLYKEALQMEIRKEMPFYVESDKRMIGVMDFVAIGSDKILLVDYKTDALPIEEIKSRYHDQLENYAWALNRLYPKLPVESYIYSLHHKCFIPMD